MHPIALLAGEGHMPYLILKEAKALGIPVFLLALKGIASQRLTSLADETKWLHLTQLGAAVRACIRRGISEVTLAGRVKHTHVFSFSLFKMDWTTLSSLIRLPDFKTDTLLNGVAEAFERKGVHMASSVKYLKNFLSGFSKQTQRVPSAKDLSSIQLGLEAARTLGGLDIGQTVVVKNGTIVAVEAMEGTDKCLERAGELAGKGTIMIKLAKPDQDMRFDVPTIGRNTIEKLKKIKAKGLVLQSEKTLMIGSDLTQFAEENQLFIHIVEIPTVSTLHTEQ